MSGRNKTLRKSDSQFALQHTAYNSPLCSFCLIFIQNKNVKKLEQDPLVLKCGLELHAFNKYSLHLTINVSHWMCSSIMCCIRARWLHMQIGICRAYRAESYHKEFINAVLLNKHIKFIFSTVRFIWSSRNFVFKEKNKDITKSFSSTLNSKFWFNYFTLLHCLDIFFFRCTSDEC